MSLIRAEPFLDAEELRQRALDVLAADRQGRRPLQGLTGADYARAHEVFEARSTQRTLLTGWLLGRLTARQGEDLAILSVGCGDGAVDAQIADALTADADGGQVTYVGVDPHAASAASFEARLRRLVRPALRVRSLVGTLGQLPASNSFDVVMFVHSLYYVQSLEETLDQARRLLRPGGEILVLQADREGLNDLAALLAPPASGLPQWWAESTEAVVASSGLHARRGTLRGELDLSVCADPEDLTGRDVLDFTVQARVPRSLYDGVLEVIRQLSSTEGELIVPHVLRTWVLSEPKVASRVAPDGDRSPPEDAVALAAPQPPAGKKVGAVWDVVATDDLAPTRAPLEGFAELMRACRLADGHAPFDNHAFLTLQGQRQIPHSRFSVRSSASLVGGAVLAEGVDSWSLELAVSPLTRNQGVASALVAAVESHVASHGGGILRSWVHGFTPAITHLSEGWRVERTLLVMRRCLDGTLPDVLTKTRPLRADERDGWLLLSNAAFQGHPENGGWEDGELNWRMDQTWTDLSRWPVVAVEGELQAGVWTKVEPGSAAGELYVVAVAPSAQGRGLGKAVVAQALQDLRARGCSSAFLSVNAKNVAAISLYRWAGFNDGEAHRCLEKTVAGS